MMSMDGMPMPGGWTMSMAWMRMPGQTWAGAALSFVGMWTAMMVPMMLPSALPMLVRARRAFGPTGARRLGGLTAVVGAGYFAVWAACGAAVFPFGVALASLEMDRAPLARAVPVAVGVVVLAAGLLQRTAWKARQLACCRRAPHVDGPLSPDAATAWRCGLRLGAHCVACCLGQTAILLVAGVMDLWVMVAVTVAITAERLAPAGTSVARALGLGTAAVGLVLVARAAGLV
jgi:predicted metal-binding membrane protein